MDKLGKLKRIEHEAWEQLLAACGDVVTAYGEVAAVHDPIAALAGPSGPMVAHDRTGLAVQSCGDLLAAVKAEDWRPR